MAIIYTTCPITGRNLSTGIETDADRFAALTDAITRIACPHCRQQHNWSKHNAFLRDPGRPRSPWDE